MCILFIFSSPLSLVGKVLSHFWLFTDRFCPSRVKKKSPFADQCFYHIFPSCMYSLKVDGRNDSALPAPDRPLPQWPFQIAQVTRRIPRHLLWRSVGSVEVNAPSRWSLGSMGRMGLFTAEICRAVPPQRGTVFFLLQGPFYNCVLASFFQKLQNRDFRLWEWGRNRLLLECVGSDWESG